MSTAQEIARYIVRFFQEAGDPVSNLKLQKLLYYVQGWHIAVRNTPAFPDRLEAWVHGPVQPGVYGTYKHYRWNAIVEDVVPAEIEAGTKEIIDAVLGAYGTDSGYELELRTHGERPWLEARGDLPADAESTSALSHETMRVYFCGLLDEDQ
jgi:uncharacterized phage-associated protein